MNTTSDGIIDEDWEFVRVCAEQLCDPEYQGMERGLLLRNLNNVLVNLKRKYGRLPSILATEADYCETIEEKISLLKEAYVTACEISDIKNKTYICSSLAEEYLFEKEYSRSMYWLNELKNDLVNWSDDYTNDLFDEVKEELDKKINEDTSNTNEG